MPRPILAPVQLDPGAALGLPVLYCRTLDWWFSEDLEPGVPLNLEPDPIAPIEARSQVEAKAHAVGLQLPAGEIHGDLPACLIPQKNLIGYRRIPPVKLVAVAAILVIAAIWAIPTSRKVRTVGPQLPSEPAPIFSNVLHHVRGTIGHRAAVDLSEDFRSGLGDWQTRSGRSSAWTFDRTGFVQPGSLALFRPTMELSNYNVDFLTQVAERPLGVAFRVQDWDNYYALRLRIDHAGPQPRIDLTRYAVVNGRETGHLAHSISPSVRNLSLYHIKLKISERNFTLIVEGHVVDYWTDRRYGKGGFGFFNGKGERARVISVEVSHQHDWLGRFCALLTPYRE